MMTQPLEHSSAMLMEKIVDADNLVKAWNKVRSNRGAPGPDGITIDDFPDHCREHWPVIKQQLLEGTYVPSPARRKSIPKPDGGERHLAPKHLNTAKRDGPCDSTSRPTSPDSDFRSGVLRIELWISTETFRSGRSQTGTALYQIRLSPMR